MKQLPTLTEFRRIRDTVALENYRARKPVLKDLERRLRARVTYLTEQRDTAADKHARKEWEAEQIKEYWKLQRVTALLSSIETDTPIREARLKGKGK